MKKFERMVRRGKPPIAMQHETKDPQKITGDGPEDFVKLMEFTIAVVDRAKVEGRMDELGYLPDKGAGDGEILRD